MKKLPFVFSLALLLGSGIASAQQAAATAEAPPPPASVAPKMQLFRVNTGLKMGYVPNRAFDVYGENNALPQLSIDATYTLFSRGRFAFGAGAGWDVGGSSATVRGFDSSLTSHRLYVPLEARLHFRGWYAFGKVAPGAAAMIGTIKDPSAPDGEITSTGWAFAADASLGASFLLGPRKNLDKRAVRFWATPELGYSYTTNAPVRPSPGRAEEDQLGADQRTDLRTLALSGFFWRASIGMTF